MDEGDDEPSDFRDAMGKFCGTFPGTTRAQVEMDRLPREFLTMEKTTESIPELNRKFNEMALFCP